MFYLNEKEIIQKQQEA